MKLLSASLTVFLLTATPLHAQSPLRYGIGGDEGRFHAGAAVVVERMPELPGQGLTWSLALGADLTGRLGVRFMFEPAREARGFERVFTQPSQPLPTRVTVRETRRLQTWAVMGDWRWPLGPRMQLAALYGVAIVAASSELTRETEAIQPDGTPLPGSSTRPLDSRERLGAPVAGVELPISLGQLALVPEVRIIYMLNPESAEPFVTRGGVGVRWRF